MRMPMMIAGVLLVLIGGVWILQGINVLPGSFMTGQTKWALIGGVMILASIALFIFANRRPRG